MKKEVTNEVLTLDAILSIKTMQEILIKKGLFTKEEFIEEMNLLSKSLLKSILEKANVGGDLDILVNDLSKIK